MIEAYQFRKAAQATFDKMVDTVNAILKEFLAQRKEAADNLKSAQEKVDALEKQLHPLEKLLFQRLNRLENFKQF